MANVTIIGRLDELEALEAFVARVPHGFRAFVLEGEAGVGKTILWQAGVDAATTAGCRVLAARPTGAEATLAFAGVADVLSGTFEEVLDRLPSIQRRALESVLLLGNAPAATDERVIGAATVSALRVLAERTPVCVAIDDLQWLDVPSGRVLEFALRRLREEPIALLATARIERGGSAVPKLARSLESERVERLWVGPLTAGALYELLRSRLGLSVSRPVLLRLQEVSGGNPFFALQLAQTDLDPHALPGELREIVRERLAVLSAEATSVLTAAAAIRDPTIELLERALPRVDVIAALREGAESRVAELEGARVRFEHPLLASTLYDSASARQRRLLHRRLADAISQPEESARHLALSTEGADEEVASALEEATRRVEARGALAAAADLAVKAVHLTPADDRATLHRRRLAAARVTFAAGDTPGSRELLEEALSGAGTGVERAQTLAELAHVAFTQDIWAALDFARRAAAETVEAPALRATILTVLARLVGYRGEGYQAALPYAREAVELAERAGDPRVLAEALATLADVEFDVGLGIDHAAFERAEALATAAGGTPLAVDPAYVYCQVLVDAREHGRARHRLERLATLDRERGDSRLCATLSRLVVLEYAEGNWERASDLALELEQTAAQIGWEAFHPAVLAQVALVEGLQGDVEAARQRALDALAEAEARGRRSGGPLGTLGLLELSVERYDAALGYLLESVERGREAGVREPMEVVSNAIEALAALGRVDEAQTLLAEFEQVARQLGRRWALGAAARGRGLLAAARGELEAAEAALEESCERWEELGFPFELGRSLLALGSVQRRRRRKRAARESLERAAALFDALPAPVWAERARTESGRIGGRSAPREGLSGTEDAIAGLVAAGKSNREVAEALHLSPHTVEWNLSRIYRKLGIRSRTQLAAARDGRE